VAYVNHDLDDALRCDIIKEEDIPAEVLRELGETHSLRINGIVMDIVKESMSKDRIRMSEKVQNIIEKTRKFLMEKVYFHPVIKNEGEKAEKVIAQLYHFYISNPEILKEKVQDIAYPKGTSVPRMAVDYLSMMTDNFALEEYKNYLLPKRWFRFDVDY
jgi:dGTPase